MLTRVKTAVVALSATWLIAAAATPAHAQEREARRRVVAAAARLETALADGALDARWREHPALVELALQLDAGKTADTVAVRQALANLAQGPAAGAAAMADLNRAVGNWLTPLESVQPPSTGDVLRSMAAEVDLAVNSRASFSLELREQLTAFDRRLERHGATGAGWRRFLVWDKTVKLARGEPLTGADLDQLEARWTSAQAYWNTFWFRLTAQTVVRAIVLRRRTVAADLAAISRQAVAQLAPSPTSDAAASSAQVAAAAGLLDRLDLGAELTLAHHRRHRFPHCRLLLNAQALAAAGDQQVDETFPISDVFAGVVSRGTGRVQGTLSLAAVVDRPLAAWELAFSGESTSSTVSGERGVSVTASARTAVRGAKRIVWQPLGIIGEPASAQASAAVSIDGIAAGGGGRRQSTARSEVFARRGAAQRDTEQAARSACVARLDGHAEQLLRPLNDFYQRAFLRPIQQQTVFTPRVATAIAGESASWSCWYAPVEGLGAVAPPGHAADRDWSLVVHEDFLARHAEASLSSRKVTAAQLSELVSQWTTAPSATSPGPEDPAEESETVFHLRADKPVEVQLDSQSLVVRLHLDEIRAPAGNTTIPATVEFAYRAALEGKSLLLVRAAQPSVRIHAEEGAASGRQLTLKRLLIRQFSRALPERLDIDPDSLRKEWLPESKLDLEVELLQIADGWLQVAGAFSIR